MKKHYFRFLLLCGLLVAFGTVSFAQKTKQKRKTQVRPMIVSTDFESPKTNVKTNKSARKKSVKKWKKRCRYVYFKRNGKIYRRYRCINRKN